MAKLFGASDKSLTLDRGATEAALRQDPMLANSRVIAIATHGLLPDPQLGLGEPGLVMTPPATPSDLDDGLLTATEAAQLDLSADWVILSAQHGIAPAIRAAATACRRLPAAFSTRARMRFSPVTGACRTMRPRR